MNHFFFAQGSSQDFFRDQNVNINTTLASRTVSRYITVLLDGIFSGPSRGVFSSLTQVFALYYKGAFARAEFETYRFFCLINFSAKLACSDNAIAMKLSVAGHTTRTFFVNSFSTINTFANFAITKIATLSAKTSIFFQTIVRLAAFTNHD